MTFYPEKGIGFRPMIEPQHQERIMMYVVVGDIWIFYEDHDHPRFLKIVHFLTGAVLDVKVRPQMGDIQEFITENYEHGAYRESMANKVVAQGWCPVCKEDSFYYLPFKRTCTDFGRNEHEELHFGFCSQCNHIRRYKDKRE
jgi:hypothetical protein